MIGERGVLLRNMLLFNKGFVVFCCFSFCWAVGGLVYSGGKVGGNCFNGVVLCLCGYFREIVLGKAVKDLEKGRGGI